MLMYSDIEMLSMEMLSFGSILSILYFCHDFFFIYNYVGCTCYPSESDDEVSGIDFYLRVEIETVTVGYKEQNKCPDENERMP